MFSVFLEIVKQKIRPKDYDSIIFRAFQLYKLVLFTMLPVIARYNAKPVIPKSRAVQLIKPKTSVQMPVKEQKHKEKVPMFSISELQSDKYAPTSSKAKDIGRTKKNDLDL